MGPELGSLRAELKAAGMFEYCELRSWLKLAVMAATFAACLLGVWQFGWLAAIPLVPIAAVHATAMAMFGHEGSHRSFSASPVRNLVMLYLVFPLFSGLSSRGRVGTGARRARGPRTACRATGATRRDRQAPSQP